MFHFNVQNLLVWDYMMYIAVCLDLCKVRELSVF